MTRSQATPASSQIIALEGVVQRLEQQLADEREKTAKWERVFGHLGTADECGNEWLALGDKLAAAQARIAELREALESVKAQRIDGFVFPLRFDLSAWTTKVINALAKPDDLSALEEAKQQARREALMEAAKEGDFGLNSYGVRLELRRMAREVK